MNSAGYVARVWRYPRPQYGVPMYRVTDRLQDGRTAHVLGNQIGTTNSAWLAELGAASCRPRRSYSSRGLFVQHGDDHR
jgi:hypothetical protein